ncbi:MAG: cytochrome c oxidase subunit II [Firmicutes bacterium]|nr:cytochrome c oxidase subunit II [Bacillota bacterium]
MPKRRRRWPYRYIAPLALVGLLVSGCGQQYVLLHPVGPVGKSELHLLILASLAMGIVIALVLILLAITVIRFRDKPGNRAPYTPEWRGNKTLETIWWIVPVVLLTVIAIPMVNQTFALAKIPKTKDPVVIDVTSLTWKWLFQYPGHHVATVNYLEIPTGEPVLFELTADSPMNTFWVPQLGGMEYTMPNRVLPLWLEADKPGVYWGHSGNYSGIEFEKMFFDVKAVSPAAFNKWLNQTHRTAPPMTMQDYHSLLKFNTVGYQTYGNYPTGTFPSVMSGYTLNGSGMYLIEHDQHGLKYVPMSSN